MCRNKYSSLGGYHFWGAENHIVWVAVLWGCGGNRKEVSPTETVSQKKKAC